MKANLGRSWRHRPSGLVVPPGYGLPAFDPDVHQMIFSETWDGYGGNLANAIANGWNTLTDPRTNFGTEQDYTSGVLGANHILPGARTGGTGSHFSRVRFEGVPNDGNDPPRAEGHVWGRGCSELGGKHDHAIILRQWIRAVDVEPYPLEDGYARNGQSTNRIQLKWLEFKSPAGGGDRSQFSCSYGVPKTGSAIPWVGSDGNATMWAFLGHNGIMNADYAMQTRGPFLYQWKNTWALHEHWYQTNSANPGTCHARIQTIKALFFNFGTPQSFSNGDRIPVVGANNDEFIVSEKATDVNGNTTATLTRASSNTGATVSYSTVYLFALPGSQWRLDFTQSQFGQQNMVVGNIYAQMPTVPDRVWDPYTIVSFDGASVAVVESWANNTLNLDRPSQIFGTRTDGRAEMYVNGQRIVSVAEEYVGVVQEGALPNINHLGEIVNYPAMCERSDIQGMYTDAFCPSLTWYGVNAGYQLPYWVDMDDLEIYMVG